MSQNDPELVTITKQEYSQLLDDQQWRHALTCGGVENWEWYEASLEEYSFGADDES